MIRRCRLRTAAVTLVAGVVFSLAGPASADPPSEFAARMIVVVRSCDDLVAPGGPTLPHAPDLTRTFWADVDVRSKPWRQDPNATPTRMGRTSAIDGTGVDAAGQEFRVRARLHVSWTVPPDFQGFGEMTVQRSDGSRADGRGTWAASIVTGGSADTLSVVAEVCKVK